MDKDKFNIDMNDVNYRIQEAHDKHSEKVKLAKEQLDAQYNELIKKKQAPSK
jgi:hypothetical protein